MSEYWKSTPKYWCKHCSVYVRDTKLERTNHEATGRHQGGLKRSLRDLHRAHENEEREKERARREIQRLNGVVPGTTAAAAAAGTAAAGTGKATPSSSSSKGGGSSSAAVAREQRQRQWEQLAAMGIDMPTELRSDMAMAGEWQVTATRVIDDEHAAPKPEPNPDAVVTGVKKSKKRSAREGDEDDGEEEEAEDAMKNLFKNKKPRTGAGAGAGGRWGRDAGPSGVDEAELDALLSIPLAPVPRKDEDKEDVKEDVAKVDKTEEVKKEDDADKKVKPEPQDGEVSGLEGVKPKIDDAHDNTPAIKTEEEGAGPGGVEAPPAVVFKKRKPKNIRQK